MEISKIIFNGKTLMDISEDTVKPVKLIAGETAHASNGEKIVGSLDLNVRSGFYVDENGLLYFTYKGE